MSTMLLLADRIEHAVDQPSELKDLRAEVESTAGLAQSERDALIARIGEYLADTDRAAGYPDADPEELDPAISSGIGGDAGA